MPWTAHIDGGSRGNPGPSSAGVVLRDPAGQTVFAAGFFLGRMTNNQAEYNGLLKAIDLFERADAKDVEFVSDSELMVRQINGQYKVRSPDLRPLYEDAMAGLENLHWRIRHVLREKNADADALANEAMDAGDDVVRVDTAGLRSRPTQTSASSLPAESDTTVIEAQVCGSPKAGVCPAATRKGQAFRFSATTPPGMCVHLCAAALPVILDLQKEVEGTARRIPCGKTGCGAVLEVRRVSGEND